MKRVVSLLLAWPQSPGLALVGVLFFLFFLPREGRADAVIINFPAALAGEASTGFGTSTGGSLSGNLVRIGAFDTNPTSLMAGVAALTTPSAVLSNLNSRFTQYTSFTFSNDYLNPDTAIFPATDADGIPLETQPAIGTSLQGKDIYLLFYNAATANSATEVAIFRMKQDLLLDDPAGSTGVFNTGETLNKRTAFFNLSVTETDLLLGFYNSQTDRFQTADLNGGIGQIFNENKTAAVGSAVSELILNNFGANSFSESGLPASLSIQPTTGLLSGTFAAGTFTITASNTLTGVSVNKTLTYTASTQPPVITGIVPNEATFGIPADITIQINNGATAVNVSGLPAGLSHAGGSSLSITGTPTVAGNFGLNITASNSAGSDTQTIPLTVLPGTAPDIYTSDGLTISARQNVEYLNTTDTNSANFLYRFKTDLDGDPIRKPVSFSLPANVASNLNAIGMFLNPTNGVLYGRPTAGTNLVLPVTISNAAIGSTTNFTLSILYAKPELAVTNGTATVGKPFNIPLLFTEASRVTSLQLDTVPPSLAGLVQLNINQLTNATLTGTYRGVPTTQELTFTGGNEDATNNNLKFFLTLEPDTGRPNLTSTNAVAGKVGVDLRFQLTADNNPGSFAISGTNALPPGLSLNSTSGLVSGVPTEEGRFPVTFTAANGNGTGPGQTVGFTIDLDPPAITSPSVALGTISRSFSFALTAAPNPTAFLISSGILPAGLSLAPDTGLISGTPTVSGSFVLGVQARNSKGLGSASSLTLVISKLSPVITTENLTTGNAEQPYSATVRADNEPDSFSASGLPDGLSINAAGIISGTPTTTFNGDVTITASNSAGSARRVFRLVINPVVVILTSTNLRGTVGTPLSLQLTANPPNDLIFSEGRLGLPAGLSLSSGGLISGTPRSAGSGSVTLKVERRGQITEDLRFTRLNFFFTNPAFSAPDADPNGVLTFRAGQANRKEIRPPENFTITAANFEGVPEGLSWDGTGLGGTPLAGTRATATNRISLTASLTGDASVTLTTNYLVRVAVTPATLGLAGPIEVEVGKNTRIPLTFGGTEALLTASGLPPGLTLANGVLTGTNTSTNGPHEWSATLTADNADFTGGTNVSQLLTIRLRNPVPVMINPRKVITGQGRSTFLDLRFDALSVDRVRAAGLPAGVTLADRKLTVPTSLAPGVYRVTITSENLQTPGDLTSALQTPSGDIMIFVDNAPPTAVAAAVPSAVEISAQAPVPEVRLIPEDAGARVAGYGLPPGVTIDPATGVVSGTPTQSGDFNATIFVQNGKRWLKKKLSFLVR